MKKVKFKSGDIYNFLTIIEEISIKSRKSKVRMVVCRCKCGNIINAQLNGLRSGNTKSCGCWQKEYPPTKTHGMSKTRFYNRWAGIKDRCNREGADNYKYYGAIGIKVCERWENSFENFYKDMYKLFCKHERKYGKKNTTIERIDNNKGYYKENCTWTTIAGQMLNRRGTRFIELNGVVRTISAWAMLLKIGRKTITYRLNKKYPPEVCLSKLKLSNWGDGRQKDEKTIDEPKPARKLLYP